MTQDLLGDASGPGSRASTEPADAVSAVPASIPIAQTWRLIDAPPPRPMDVLLYAALATWTDWPSGDIADVPDGVRYEVGYWTGDEFRHHGTNHAVFEHDFDPDQCPTHWSPLLEPPAHGIEALGRDPSSGLDAQHESPVPAGDAPEGV